MKKIIIVLTLLFLTACSQLPPEASDVITPNPSIPSEPTPVESDLSEPIISEPVATELEMIAPRADMCDHLDDIGDYELVWCDEFDYQGLPDPVKWNYDVGGHGWGNNELQYYTRENLNNVVVKDGNLIITARKENFGQNQYTSTRLLTAGKAEFKYGYIEVRAKLPQQGGTWPAIWMLGTTYGTRGWPACGEIDIMEHVANDLNVIHGSVHTGNYNHRDNTQKTGQIVLDDVHSEYNIYAIEWTPKQIRFFVNGINYFTFNNDEINNPDDDFLNWPFDTKFFLILNVAIGGWGGTVQPNFTEASMYVDYVRVYQKTFADEDTEHPTQVENIQVISQSPLDTHLQWNASFDDFGVRYYGIYLDDELIATTDVAHIRLRQLQPNTNYELKIIAYDFYGKASEPSIIELTTSGYPTVGDRIEAEAYYDMRGIQLEATQDEGGGQNVGWTDPGDFLIYKFSVDTAGTYRVLYRIAALHGGRITISFNDEVMATTTFSVTGGWQSWRNVESTVFELEPGEYTIRIDILQGGFNINWFSIVEVIEES